MAVIISNDNTILTNNASKADNDTNWMQDLVVESKPEIVAAAVPASKDIIQETPAPKENIVVAEQPKQENPTLYTEIKQEPQKDPMITNMYIAADQDKLSPKEAKTITTDIDTAGPKPTNPRAINLDDLFGNIKPSESTNYEPAQETIKTINQTEQSTKNDSHTLQKVMFGLAWSLAVIAGWFFIIKTIFPLTFSSPTTPTQEIVNTGAIVDTIIEQEEIHTAPPIKTLAEVYTEKLTTYASSGEFYHQFGRETKNRNLIRYGLFIHKKSLDLQDDIQKAIVLSGEIDTVSIEAYLAQFDEYVGILEETVANDPELQTALNAFTGPSSQTEDNGNFAPQTPEAEQNTGDQVNTQPTLDQFLNQVTQPQ